MPQTFQTGPSEGDEELVRFVRAGTRWLLILYIGWCYQHIYNAPICALSVLISTSEARLNLVKVQESLSFSSTRLR